LHGVSAEGVSTVTTLADVVEGRARWHVALCDCRFALAGFPDACVDAVVTDAPYGLSFMGESWDTFTPEETERRLARKRRKTEVPEGQHGRPGELATSGIEYDLTAAGNRAFQTWCTEWARELLRVAKPGAFLFCFGGTRTYHRLACGIEDAGWEIRDSLAMLYGSGFPKSVNVVKAAWAQFGPWPQLDPQRYELAEHVAREWEGYGTGLKPGFEPTVVARKPLAGTVVSNVLEHGTGVLNIDACRIAVSPEDFEELSAGVEAIRARGGSMDNSWKNSSDLSGANPASPLGRWPANVVLEHSAGCELVGTKTEAIPVFESSRSDRWIDREDVKIRRTGETREQILEDWRCAPDCPVRLLDEQAGERPGMSGGGVHRPDYAGGLFGSIDSTGTARADSGGPSRFFYTAKASAEERSRGLDDGEENIHPTVKSLAVIRWQVRMACPPRGLVLDLFTGSGTTGVAVMTEGEGRRFIGLERVPEYVDIARQRIAHVFGGSFEREVRRVVTEKPAQPSLFDRAVSP
jgi:DNA modification methylase